MADVYGRLTCKAGVCLSTLGPAATNLITGVADADMDRAPVVAVAGQGATTRMHKESHRILDLVNMFEPITKYATQIREPEIVIEIVGRPSHVEVKNPDFVKYAESFGAKGYRIERAGDLEPTLKRALAGDTVAIIDCPVDDSENMKLTEKLTALKSPV